MNKEEVQLIIDALLFLSCTDACYSDGEDRIGDDFKRLELAKKLKEQYGLDGSDRISIFDGILEDKKQAEFIKEHFGIKIEG